MKRICVLIIFLFITLNFIGCGKTDTNISNYLKSGQTIDQYAKDVMPDLDNLPTYKKADYRYEYKPDLFFEHHTMVLVVTYDDKTYKSEKNKLDEKYVFLNHVIKFQDKSSEYIIPEYEFSINSYHFRVVEGNGNDNTKFPKYFGMIGTSEEKNSIAYLYFYDYDLDYISSDEHNRKMADFINEYFDYNF